MVPELDADRNWSTISVYGEGHFPIVRMIFPEIVRGAIRGLISTRIEYLRVVIVAATVTDVQGIVVVVTPYLPDVVDLERNGDVVDGLCRSHATTQQVRANEKQASRDPKR